MVDERKQHGRHAHGDVRPLALHELEDEPGLEARDEHGGREHLADLERHHLAPDVVERHRVDVDVPCPQTEPHGAEDALHWSCPRE